MNIEKYIELLRFYVTEKIEEVNSSIEKSITDVIDNFISTIFAAILALIISTECIRLQGVWGIIMRVFLLIIAFLIAFFVVKKFKRFFKTKKELDDANNKRINLIDAKRRITDFDHIACDSILLSWDFLKKFNSIKTNENEEMFCLIETIYYYKKALFVTETIVTYSNDCVKSVNQENGVAPYRIKNASASLDEIHNKIKEALLKLNISEQDEMSIDVMDTEQHLSLIKKYVNTLP